MVAKNDCERLVAFFDELGMVADHIRDAMMIAKPQDLTDCYLLLALARDVAGDTPQAVYSTYMRTTLLPRMIGEAAVIVAREAGIEPPGGAQELPL